MNKQEFYRSLSNIKSAKESFDYLDNLSYKSVEPWVNLFGLPLEPHSIGYVQKLRSSLMAAISFYFGVKHLNGKKFEPLGLKELDKCKQLTKNVLEFDSTRYRQMYSFLTNPNDKQ